MINIISPKINIRVAYLFCVIMMGGCYPTLNLKDSPTEVEKEYNISFEKAWNAVVEVISMSQGNIICKDSGFILYSIHDKQSDLRHYINIYIKTKSDKSTLIYFVPYSINIHIETAPKGPSPYLTRSKRMLLGTLYVPPHIDVFLDENTLYFVPYTWGRRSLKEIDKEFYDKLNKLIKKDNNIGL